ncbi:MAG: hypothetical protein NTU47_00035 [Ignavibacteriales bacterium]|nr:hypothetical protein [Ignavibacteriales bacterium]
MNYYLSSTLEICLTIVTPLLFLYLRSSWPQRSIIPCMVSIPVLWYPVYSPIHELSHVAATYLVGGKVTSMKLIPSFWNSEFGRAWITTEGVTQSWQQLITTGAPYMLDLACLVTGMLLLRRTFSGNPFWVGLVFMLLCLRPAFDFVCETVGFITGDRGDFYALQGIIGSSPIWLFIVLSLGLSLLAIVNILRSYAGFPKLG